MSALPAEQFGLQIRRFQETAVRAIKNIKLPSPVELYDLLGSRGYCGQEEARKAVCLAAYRHFRRLQYIHLEGIPAEAIPPKSNLLLMGPTGCGKTYLIEQLFKELLGLPTVITDVTMLSETGYIGQDPCTVLTQLVQAAGGHPALAEMGIVCLDEFDKLATGNNNGVFSGQGTTKDVTGRGVQRELLKMLESSEIQVPVELNTCYTGPRVGLSTRDIAFIACGAFSGFKQVVQKENCHKRLGFGQTVVQKENELIQSNVQQDEGENITAFLNYGFMPELIGRFSRIIPFEPLPLDTLEKIVRSNYLPRYAKEFELEGIKLHAGDAFVTHLAKDALRRKTGARGISAAITKTLENVAFEKFSTSQKNIEVSIVMEDGDVPKPRVIEKDRA